MKLLILLVLIVPQILFAQTSGTFNASVGSQGENAGNTVIGFSGDVGHTFYKELYTFGGMKFDKNFIDNPSEVNGEEENNSHITTYIWNFNLYTGIRYSVTLKNFGKLAAVERIGFFPEIRGYFTPHVPNRYYYYNENDEVTKLKGSNTTQFAYGIGGGIFLGTIDEAYLAIKYEFSTLDPFAVVRTLEPHKISFPEGAVQHLITLSIYIR